MQRAMRLVNAMQGLSVESPSRVRTPSALPTPERTKENTQPSLAVLSTPPPVHKMTIPSSQTKSLASPSIRYIYIITISIH